MVRTPRFHCRGCQGALVRELRFLHASRHGPPPKKRNLHLHFNKISRGSYTYSNLRSNVLKLLSNFRLGFPQPAGTR